MEETWLPLVGEFERFPYEVSSLGRIRSKWSKWAPLRECLKHHPDDKGYHKIVLTNLDGQRRRAALHRLVARAFLGDPPTSSHQINHKDSDKSNNSPANLEWVTAKENVHHSFEVGFREPCNPQDRSRWFTREQVRAIRLLAIRGVSGRFMARWFGVSNDKVYKVIRQETYANAL